MANPQRHPKTGVYRLRQAVPADLRQAVAVVLGRDRPVGELIRTLGTRDSKTAKIEMAKASAWAADVLAAARDGAKPLTTKETYALAGLWYRGLLHLWEASPASVDAWDDWNVVMPDVDDDPDDQTARREWDTFLRPFIVAAEDLLAAERFHTDPDSKRRLAKILVERLADALARFAARQRGDWSPDPVTERTPPLEKRVDPAVPDVVRASVSITGLLERWKSLTPTKPRTKAETTYIVNRLVAFLGHDDAAKITKADLRAWRDAGKADGIENNTLNHRLSRVRQVLMQGVRDDVLTDDASKGLDLTKQKKKSYKHYDEAEAAQILNAARLETRASQRWAHWIMAFTGMRVAEVLQLTKGDIRLDGNIPFIHVNEDDPTKSVKTSERRNVPIHTALITEGFLDYVATVPGNAPLFPDKRLDANGNRGGRGWQVVGRWVRDTVGITDPDKAPDHSWRHRTSYWLRKTGADKDDRDGLLGHAEQGTGARYGATEKYGAEGAALARLARTLAEVPLPAGVVTPPPALIPWREPKKPHAKKREGAAD